MSHDLRDRIHRSAARPSSPPDISRAWGRGRRRRWQWRLGISALVVGLAAGGWAAPKSWLFESSETTPVGPSEQGLTADPIVARAATMSIRAIAKAGLLDPEGAFYTYEGIEAAGDGWIASFKATYCSGPPPAGNCDSSDDRADLRVASRGASLMVVEASGRIEGPARAELVGYREPAVPEEPTFELLSADIVDGPEGGRAVAGSLLWTGPVPMDGSAACHLEVLNEAGTVIHEGKQWPHEAPQEEEDRGGGIFVAEFSDAPSAASAQYVCDELRVWTAIPALGSPPTDDRQLWLRLFRHRSGV